MGRKRSRFHNLPPRMRAKVRGRVTYYFYDQRPARPAEFPLGKSYPDAIKKWAEMESGRSTPAPAAITFRHAAERYQREVIPLKRTGTQIVNLQEMANLLAYFDDPPAPIGGIEPQHVAAYLDWRTDNGRRATVSANREKALLSHIWNKCRRWGWTSEANPCRGIEGYTETGREVYVEDSVFSAVYAVADQPLRDALDLAYLVGQRVADTLAFDADDVRDKVLHIDQEKTGTKNRIKVEGALRTVLARIKKRKATLPGASSRLVVDEDGKPLRRDQLRYRFDKARRLADVPKEAFQFRDIRAKAGTDKAESSGDIRQAQKQLGHAQITMTEHYIRNRKGDKSTPTSRRTVPTGAPGKSKLQNKSGIAEQAETRKTLKNVVGRDGFEPSTKRLKV